MKDDSTPTTLRTPPEEVFGVYVPDAEGRKLCLVTLSARRTGDDANSAESIAALYGGVIIPLSVLP